MTGKVDRSRRIIKASKRRGYKIVAIGNKDTSVRHGNRQVKKPVGKTYLSHNEKDWMDELKLYRKLYRDGINDIKKTAGYTWLEFEMKASRVKRMEGYLKSTVNAYNYVAKVLNEQFGHKEAMLDTRDIYPVFRAFYRGKK